MTNKTTKKAPAAKKPRKTRARKPTKITTEKEFIDSITKKKKPPFAVLDVARSVINAIIYCECGISLVKLQGPHGNYLQCERCNVVYALETNIGLTKLTKAQKDFLKDKKGLEFDDR